MSFDKEIAKKEIKLLIDKYEKVLRDNKKYNEEMTKKDFILPLFRALGWNVEDSSEVIAEEKISKKRVDYSFRINGIPKFFLEAKALDVDLNKEEYIQQAINYAWHKGCTWAVLTNFRSILIFNAEWISLNPFLAHFKSSTYDEFIKDFDDVLWLLSKESFENGIIDKVAEKYGKKAKKLPIDKQLLSDFTRFRELLSKNIFKNNKDKGLTEDDVDESVQRILDRLIFIRNCEDRELEPKKLLSAIRESKDRDNLIKYIRDIFSGFDKDYNSKIFAPHLCDELFIDKDVLIEIIEGLYHTKDKTIEYDFSAIEADVLGNIYEQYLGHILKKSEKKSQIKESYKKRKEQGIYYTPTYIVDYIVKNTLGEVLKNKKLEEVEKIRVLDPACGSGSFLIKAFDVLNEYYKKNDKKYSQIKLDFENGDTYTRKVGILRNNIFGVDLDKQAVEIAQLNLLLKIAEKGHRLPLLQDNIKCGNSLIDDPDIAGDKAFKWEEEFKEIMKEGGFDVIISNPPYERTLYIEKEKEYYNLNYKSAYGSYDILILFLEKAIILLKNNGYLGFIVSNKFLVSDYGKKIREFILENCKIIKIIDLSDAKRVFPDALVSPVIIILQKTKRKTNYSVKLLNVDKSISSLDNVKYKTIELNKLILKDGTFNVRYNKELESIYEKIDKCKHFGDYFEIRTGIMGFEYWNLMPFIHEGKKSKHDIRIITNSHIEKYRFTYGKKIKIYNKHFREIYANIEKLPINENTKKVFIQKNKIIVRGVARSLTAMLDQEGVGLLVAVHTILPNNKFHPKFILGLLNSKFFNWIHKDRFYLGRIPEGSLKYPVSFLKKLPIPEKIKDKDKDKIIKLVDKMLLLHNKLNELENKKTDEYYKIQNEISKTDNEIDQLVYAIYNITEDEQKIIEESLNQN